MSRASVALAAIQCLRTVFPPGGQPFPHTPLKADRQELPCRCARTGGAVAGVQVSWLADRRLPSAFPRCLLPQWLVGDGGSSLTVARQLRFRTGFPWCPARILAGAQSEVAGLANARPGEVEHVGRQREVEVARWEAGPRTAHRPSVALAGAQRGEQRVEVWSLAADQRLHVAGARVVLWMVGRSDEREGGRSS